MEIPARNGEVFRGRVGGLPILGFLAMVVGSIVTG
jgi:hypothetical protein